MVAAYPTHNAQELPPELRNQGFQRPFRVAGKFELKLVHPFRRDARMRQYLIYHVDQGLRLVLVEILGCFSFFGVTKYSCN